jgi:hypothetical protein
MIIVATSLGMSISHLSCSNFVHSTPSKWFASIFPYSWCKSRTSFICQNQRSNGHTSISIRVGIILPPCRSRAYPSAPKRRSLNRAAAGTARRRSQPGYWDAEDTPKNGPSRSSKVHAYVPTGVAAARNVSRTRVTVSRAVQVIIHTTLYEPRHS